MTEKGVTNTQVTEPKEQNYKICNVRDYDNSSVVGFGLRLYMLCSLTELTI